MRPGIQLLAERYLRACRRPSGAAGTTATHRCPHGNERRRLDVLEILQAPRISFADRHGSDSMPSKTDNPRPTIVQPWLSVFGYRSARRLRVRAAFLAADERCAAVRRAAALCACRDNAFGDTVPRGSRLSACVTARDLRLRALGFADALPGFIGVFGAFARSLGGFPW